MNDTSANPFEQEAEPLESRMTTGLAKIGLALKTNAWREAEREGLTPTQGEILALLAAKSRLRPSAVADALAIKRPTATESINALDRKGLIEKRTDPGDNRATTLVLTRPGRAAARRIAHWPDFMMSAMAVLGPAEQAVFHRAILKLIRTLQTRGEIPVSRMCLSCRFFQANAHADTDTPHHCAFVDAPFGERHLRIDCKDHETADPALERTNWTAFIAGDVEGGA